MIMTARAVRAALLVALAVALACDSPTAPNPAASLGADLAQMTIEFLPESVSRLPSQLPASLGTNSCTYDAASASFVCTPLTLPGFTKYTVRSAFTPLSASGAPQSSFDPATSASIRTTISATFESQANDVPIPGEIEQTLTLSGLTSGARVLNGLQTAHVRHYLISRFPPFVTEVNEYAKTTIDNVAMPAPGGDRPYPLSGTITVSTTGGNYTGAIVSSVSFNGSSTATVLVTTSAGTQTCSLLLPVALKDKGALRCK